MKKRNKNILKIVIPILITLTLIVICFISYKILFKENLKEKSFLEKLETTSYGNITKYAIYGIHMNIEGNFILPEQVEKTELVLSNGKTELTIPWILKEEENVYTFKTSEYINEGINLESLPIEDLYLLIKTESLNEKNEKITKYYSVENKSIYKDLEYYTLTKEKKNNKIDIKWNTYDECPTLKFQIKETKLPNDVYDITIDPGHDATDPGKTVCFDGTNLQDPTSSGYCNFGTKYKESDMNLLLAKALKEKLENLGYKVIMTRNTEDDIVNIYDPMGSATMANDTKSKFSLAIHNNSSGENGGVDYLKGFEIYIANDITFDLAEILVESLETEAGTQSSPKEKYKIANGIYQRFFTEEEIGDDLGYWTTDMIYYYYIREVGGISTHAAQDGIYRPNYPKNEHYESNNTAEPYLFELGYMDNKSDLNNIIQNSEGYANGIANALQKYLEQE